MRSSPVRCPVSATIGILAYLLALVVGITAGSMAALKPNSNATMPRWRWQCWGSQFQTSSWDQSCFIFSLTLYWFPPSRWNGFPSRNVVLPVFTLVRLYMAYIARLTRAGMLEVLRSDYIRTARAKGLSETQVVLRHALRGGLYAGRFLHRTGAGVSVNRNRCS